MPNHAKTKGDRAERELALQLALQTGWPVRRKLGAGRTDDTGDLDGLPDCTAQVKNYSNPARAVREILLELEQQRVNAGTTFAAGFVRHPGGNWSVTMTIPQLLTLLREATTPAPHASTATTPTNGKLSP
jgi:Holliday junction resolvase